MHYIKYLLIWVDQSFDENTRQNKILAYIKLDSVESRSICKTKNFEGKHGHLE